MSIKGKAFGETAQRRKRLKAYHRRKWLEEQAERQHARWNAQGRPGIPPELGYLLREEQ